MTLATLIVILAAVILTLKRMDWAGVWRNGHWE